MSTTDSREAFLEWKREEGDIPNYIPDATIMASGYSDFELKAWQAALAWQAAKATGTAGELPPLPEPTIEGSVMHSEMKICYRALVHFTADQMREYGQACAEAARHDKDGNHADDLRGMLDELQAEFDKQQAAFWACSEKLAQFQRDQETELSDIRILELAEEDFGEQDDRNVKNEALLSFARRVQAARQPAPVVDDEAPKRVIDYITAFDKRLISRGFDHAQRMEIVGLLVSKETQDAALAATAAPVLSDERIDWLANCACSGGIAYPSQVKTAIRDALREAATNRSQP